MQKPSPGDAVQWQRTRRVSRRIDTGRELREESKDWLARSDACWMSCRGCEQGCCVSSAEAGQESSQAIRLGRQLAGSWLAARRDGQRTRWWASDEDDEIRRRQSSDGASQTPFRRKRTSRERDVKKTSEEVEKRRWSWSSR